MRRPIGWHTKPGELIYEPFSGSGTAIIAAEQTGRRCYALELAPAFVDVAVLRWQRLHGQGGDPRGRRAQLRRDRRRAPCSHNLRAGESSMTAHRASPQTPAWRSPPC